MQKKLLEEKKRVVYKVNFEEIKNENLNQIENFDKKLNSYDRNLSNLLLQNKYLYNKS